MRISAAQVLVEGWKEDPDTLKILKEHAQSHYSVLPRVNAVVCLAYWWRDNPATLKLLKECAQSDVLVLRNCAAWFLGGYSKEDTGALAILKELAQSDEDDNVRKNAVMQLDKFWKDDAEIQAFLKGL
jgi:HEAT repeat protein